MIYFLRLDDIPLNLALEHQLRLRADGTLTETSIDAGRAATPYPLRSRTG